MGLNMKLRYIMVLIIVPMMGLASYFAKNTIDTEQARVDNAVRAAETTFEQAFVKDLVHELQKERGYSAGFIASNGQSFRQSLITQRVETDIVIAPALRQTPLIALLKPDEFASASSALDLLAQTRANVQNLNLTVPEMANYYTSLINDLLLASYPVTDSGTETALSALEASRAILSSAKERAGLERAMGSTVLSGGFAPSMEERNRRCFRRF